MSSSSGAGASAAAPPSPPRECVAVFGAAWAKPDSALYATSVALGRALAAAGFDVVNGGYEGTMAGVSEGAVAGGGGAVGVVVPTLFAFRGAGANRHVTATVETPSLLTRIDAMLARAPRLVVCLPGTLGTLTELCCAMNTALLHGLAGREVPRVFAWRAPWQSVVEHAGEALGLDAATRALVTYVDGVEEVVAACAAHAAARDSAAAAKS